MSELTLAEASEHLGVTPTTIWRKIRDGKIPEATKRKDPSRPATWYIPEPALDPIGIRLKWLPDPAPAPPPALKKPPPALKKPPPALKKPPPAPSTKRARLYTPIEVQEHANVTHRQLHYWRVSVPALHTGVAGSGSRCFYTWRQLCLIRTISRISFVAGPPFTIPRLFDLTDQFSTKALANGALTIRFNNEVSLVLEASPITKNLTYPDPSD